MKIEWDIMNGTIPESIGQLKKLHTLQLDWNPLMGAVSEIHFMGLTKLEHFSIYLSLATNNSLVFDTKSYWIFFIFVDIRDI